MSDLTPDPPASRRRIREKGYTLDDVRRRMDATDLMIGAVRGDTQIQAQALQGVQNSLATLSRDFTLIANAIGEEKEDGEGNYLGTGLLGRTRRVERAQRELRTLYLRWIAFGSGFAMCGGIALSILWWLLSDKLTFVLKGTGH